MNTNGNTYTIVYSTIIVVVVAAILAIASTSLKPMQQANEKAETISQILSAAKIDVPTSNSEIIAAYKDNIEEAYTVNLNGEKVADLSTEDATVYTTSQLKAENYNIADGSDAAALPVYVFKNGTKVIPIYGAGLWGPVWGYIGITTDGTFSGAIFDHSSETPGLGGKIKDDPNFRAQFDGKTFNFDDAKPFEIVKGGAPEGKANAIDAISGATMTSRGLEGAVDTWAKAYAPVLSVPVIDAAADTTACADSTACAENVLETSEN